MNEWPRLWSVLRSFKIVISEVSWNPYRPPKHGLCTSDVTKELLLTTAELGMWDRRGHVNKKFWELLWFALLFVYLKGNQWAIVVFLFHGEPKSLISQAQDSSPFLIAWSPVSSHDLHVAHFFLGLQWPKPVFLINLAWYFPCFFDVCCSLLFWWIPSSHLAQWTMANLPKFDDLPAKHRYFP